MRRWERWALNVTTGVVAVSGLAYLYMKFFMRTDDPFALVNHPWQPSMLALHVIVAPVLILIFGIVLRSHIFGKLAGRHRPNRRTGWLSLLSFAVMAFSGYLLQVVAVPGWIGGLVIIHLASSGIFLVGYGAHLVIGWQVSRSQRAALAHDPLLPDTALSP